MRYSGNLIGLIIVVAGIGLLVSLAVRTAVHNGHAEDVSAPGIIGKRSGTGARPAVAEAISSLRTHTLYHPADMLDEMPLVLWGNGGCRDNGLMYADFLRELASHGFFVISMGYPRMEGRPEPDPEAPEVPREEQPRRADETTVAQFFEAIEWAVAATSEQSGPFEGRIDIDRIAAMGHSCGGLQTIKVAADPRIATSMVLNSGVLNEGPASGLSGIRVLKADLADIKGPVAYINGGPSDIAFDNAADDVSRIHHVPVFFAYDQVGHSGTYWSGPHGGDYAEIAVDWLSWQLKGDAEAAQTFRGADCGLCRRSGWTVEKTID